MALFIRQTRGAGWEAINGDTPEDGTFPADVLADLVDIYCEVSVWEVDDFGGQDMELIVASLHSKFAGNLSDVTYRVISDWRIKNELRLSMKKTAGDSVDSVLNKASKHWVIQVNTAGDLMKLAKGFKERPPREYSRDTIMRLFAKSIQHKRISTGLVTPELWNKLIDGNYLQVVAEAAPADAVPADGVAQTAAKPSG